MKAPIVLFGATGYTGRIVAEALCHRGLEFTIAGRNADKLEALARALPWRPGIEEASVENPASLRRLLEGRCVVLNCAGPFMLHGEPVVAAAVRAGVHYADTSGELPYLRRIAERYTRAASDAGVTVAPAAAFEVALADCAAALLAEDFGPVDEVEILYHIENPAVSAGTLQSMLKVLQYGGLGYENGHWKRERPAKESREIPLPWPPGPRTGISFPSGEIATVPLHVPALRVKTFFSTPAKVGQLATGIGIALPIAARLAGKGLAKAISARASGPSELRRNETEFLISVRLRRGETRCQSVVRGKDIYGVTGWILAYAAERLLQDEPLPAGVVAPSQILHPREFFRALRKTGVERA
jgi:short subunit dehydrogenase-like uncharacterized protein